MSSNEKLFEFMYDAVIGEGGDGDLTLVLLVQNHKDVADEFEQWLKVKDKQFIWDRRNDGHGVSFGRDMESFYITNEKLDESSEWAYTQLIRTL